MSEALSDLTRYIGASETASDTVAASAVARLAATIGLDPPVPLPIRRLCGERCVFHDALRIGDDITRRSEIAELTVADGPEVSLTIRHNIESPRGAATVEERDIFYLDAGGSDVATAPEAPGETPWRREIDPDPVLLFRYSAVRFNSHRIHFDRDYAVEHEGLAGLIVHGTLSWQLMLELCRAEAPDRPVVEFSYRTYRPIYDTGPFTLVGRPANGGGAADLWAIDQAGNVATEARAEFSGSR